jgi:hypothetical protein
MGTCPEIIHRLMCSNPKQQIGENVFPFLCLLSRECYHNITVIAFSIMSEMNDSNAAALVGNPEPMDQSEDTSMPSAQQQVILYTASGHYIMVLFNLATAINSKSFFIKYLAGISCCTEHRNAVLLWQEEAIKKKFGGLMPKKPPLISKVFECAHLIAKMEKQQLCYLISN